MYSSSSHESKLSEELYLTIQLLFLLFLLNKSFPMFVRHAEVSLQLYSVLFALYYFGKLIFYFNEDNHFVPTSKYLPNRFLTSVDGLFLFAYIYLSPNASYLESWIFLYLVLQSIRYQISSTLFFASLTALFHAFILYLNDDRTLNVSLLTTTIFLYYASSFIISFSLRQLHVLNEERTQFFLELKEKNSELKKLATTDFLTDLYNHQSFYIYLDALKKQSKKIKQPLGLALIDIDNFKDINDTYGHLVGDAILKELSLLLKSELRSSDYAARYGGEEFVVAFPNTTLNHSIKLAERIKTKVANHRFILEHHILSVTVSIGVDSCLTYDESIDDTLFINTVDSLLYKAKKNGKNQVQYFLEKTVIGETFD